jgi:hypothetical protein
VWRCGDAAAMTGDASRGQKLHGRYENVAWVRILRFTAAGKVGGGVALALRR